jgi:hypothetical protein
MPNEPTEDGVSPSPQLPPSDGAAPVDASTSVQGADDDPDTAPAVFDPMPRDETDGRRLHEWRSRYPKEARKEIRFEGFAVAALLIGSIVLMFVVWSGVLGTTLGCTICSRPAFHRYSYFFLGGILGGTLFGAKYLYHVVAKGYWNQDRKLWRYLSPLLAGMLAFIIGTLTDAGFLGLTISANKPSAFVSLGFLTGYFADKALAKMKEMAEVIFGVRPDANNKKAGTSSPDKPNDKPANDPEVVR